MLNFAVLKWERGKGTRHNDNLTYVGGFVDEKTHRIGPVETVKVRPKMELIVDEPHGDKFFWEVSSKHDIRSEYSDTTLFEAHVPVSEYEATRYAHDTYNSQIQTGHLYLLQSKHDCSSDAWSIMAIDIEACGLTPGEFPDAEKDPILQISMVMQNRNAAEPENSVVLSLGPREQEIDEDDFKFIQFNSEKKLLARFVRLVRTWDPDIITGWNVLNFDIKYIADRAAKLGVNMVLGRNGSPIVRRCKTTHTRAHGTRVMHMCDTYGRIVFDSLNAFQRIMNEPSYKLGAVAQKHLGVGKDDMPYDQILPCMRTHEGRLRVARYCFKDSLLVLQLLSHFKLMHRFNGIVSVTGAPLDKVIHGGQQIRCFSALLKEIYVSDLPFAFPNITKEESEGYQGATVITPRVGATSDVIATLDFAALYPNIMRAYNMCWSTLKICGRRFESTPVTECPYHMTTGNLRRALSIKDECVINGPCGTTAFRQDVEGLIPRVQTTLYTKRKAVKKKMKSASGLEYEILDAYQLALKLVMNSMYGLLGAKKGYLPEVRIASAITCVGRMLIEWSRICAEKHPKNLSVWGGDTDSIFVHAPAGTCDGPEEYHAFWEKLANDITATYGHSALVLEYEKMYLGEPECLSWVLVAKKRYAGYKWDAWAKHGKLVYTGLECKRRDFCGALGTTMKAFLLDLFTRGTQHAMTHMHDTIVDFFDNAEKHPEHFVLSKQYFKKSIDYSNPDAMPHVRVATRSNANVGARIEFFIAEPVRGSIKASLAERARSIEEFEQNKQHIDIVYYFEKQFKKPLMRISDAVDGRLSEQTWKNIQKRITKMQSKRRRIHDKHGFNMLFRKHRSDSKT